MDSNDKTPEQKLKDAAESAYPHKHLFSGFNASTKREQQIFINGAKSEAAREYWSQSQSSEIERLTKENAELKEDYEILGNTYHKCRDLLGLKPGDDVFAACAEISSLKSQLEDLKKGIEWVSVKDGLPHDDSEVWCEYSNGEIGKSYYWNQDEGFGAQTEPLHLEVIKWAYIGHQLEAKAVDVEGLERNFCNLMDEHRVVSLNGNGNIKLDLFNLFLPYLKPVKKDKQGDSDYRIELEE